jgi:hypothetical protein
MLERLRAQAGSSTIGAGNIKLLYDELVDLFPMTCAVAAAKNTN